MRRQASELAARLTNIDAVYSSDNERAEETAEIVAQRRRLTAVEDPWLREVDFGEREGLTTGEISERFRADLERWTARRAAELGASIDNCGSSSWSCVATRSSLPAGAAVPAPAASP